MTNVPTSSQTRPPGLAITSAQQAPGECLRVSVAGKELFSATFQTGWRSVGAGSSFRAAGGVPLPPHAPGDLRLRSHAWAAPSMPAAFPSFAPSPTAPAGLRASPRRPAGPRKSRAGLQGCAAAPQLQSAGSSLLDRPSFQGFFGSSAIYFNTWDDISPGLSASWALLLL